MNIVYRRTESATYYKILFAKEYGLDLALWKYKLKPTYLREVMEESTPLTPWDASTPDPYTQASRQ